MDFGVDLAFDLLEFGGRHHVELLAQRHHGIPRLPPFDLVGCAIPRALISPRTDMPAEAIGLDLAEVRSLAGADLRQQALDRGQQHFSIIAVELVDRPAEALRPPAPRRPRLTAFDRPVPRTPVALADGP